MEIVVGLFIWSTTALLLLAMAPSSTKRPGVDASLRLLKSQDVRLWEQIDEQLSLVVNHIKDLDDAQRKCDECVSSKHSQITLEQLLDPIIRWKFKVGKARPALFKHLRSNSNKSVQEATQAAKSLALQIENDDVKEAVETLTVPLQGVGPATASVMLSRWRPDVFCYMYDEVIDCFQDQRKYTLKQYLEVNTECIKQAKLLGEKWTPARVAKTLWTAARIKAGELDTDLTTSQKRVRSENENPSQPKRTSKRTKKKR